MKRALAMVPATLLVWLSPAVSAADAVDSRIDAVTIYPGGLAQVERVARVGLDAGAGTLTLGGLPADLDDASVRVSLISGEAVIGAVEVAREPAGEAPRERERALRRELEDVQVSRQAALDRAAAARTQITFIEGLAELPQGEGAAEALTAGAGADRWSALWARIGEGSREAYQRLRASQREAKRRQQRIETLQRQLEQLGGSRRENVRISVPYDAPRAGEAKLHLAYRVRGPQWEPVYETRLDTAEGHLTLVRSARVTQATGEDWTDVRVALSTVRPVWGERPEPATWWIDLAPEAQPKTRQRESTAAQGDRAAEAFLAESAEGPMRTANAEFAATYEIPSRVSVPAGNQPRELRIGASDLTARVGAEVFPQQAPRAWLTATATWDGVGPLPAGRVSRFRDGAYVGEGRLEGWPPGEERTMAFGVDPRVQVRFEPMRDEAGESGWITSESTLARRYSLELANRHERSLPISVLFRVPVPRAEAIEVATRFSEPPSRQDIDARRGVHGWDLDLAAGESRALELGYQVRYPQGRELSGL